MCRILHNNRGLSLIELVVTMVILGILASMIIPSVKMTSTRVKEIELKRNLRDIRTAIDEYKKIYDRGVAENMIRVVINTPGGYPETLKVLVDGDDFKGYLPYKKKFLRRVPADPFHLVRAGEDAWGMRSYEDDPDSNSPGGQDVYDVYSLSEGTAIDGTKYKDW
jgi:general secretion pathway protein G